MSNQLEPITFHEDTIFIIDHDGQPFVPIRPICENLGLDWKSQYTKLMSEQELWNCGIITTVAADGKQREMVCLPLKKLNAWVLGISPSKVNPDIKDKLIVYQKECDEVLWNYWPKGVGLPDRMLIGKSLIEVDRLIELLETEGKYYKQKALPPPKRKNFTAEEDAVVLELRGQGLSLREIGLRVGRKPESVRSCLHRLEGKQ